MMENLRNSILEFSRKSKLREKFDSSKKIENPTPKIEPSTSTKSDTQPSTSSNFEANDPSVQSVLDFLPDLDKNLVKKCLKYYNNNVEQVINAFLENNLPEFPSEESKEASPPEYTELNSRKNIYDNDEFDIFSKEKVDLSKIHMGKK